MHVTVSTVASEDRKVAELRELIESVLQPGQKKTWAQMIKDLTEARTTPNHEPSRATVARWINQAKVAGVLNVDFGAYFLGSKSQVSR